MTAVVFAALAGSLFGLFTVLVRLALRHGADPEVGALVTAPVALVVSMIAAAAHGDFAHLEPAKLWQFALVGLLVPGLSQVLFIRSVRAAGPSRSAILIGLAPLMSVALAFVFLGEPVRLVLVVGTVIVVAGGLVLAGERVRPADFRAAGAMLALTCAGLYAIRDNLVRGISRHEHAPPLLASSASLLAGSALMVVALVLFRRRGLADALRRALPAFAIPGIVLGVAYSSIVWALARGRVTIAAPLNATQSLWAVVFAVLFIGRSELIGRRTVLAGLLVVAGGALIGATR
jgi:drug/metabolite transporter (DMT)-like permease